LPPTSGCGKFARIRSRKFVAFAAGFGEFRVPVALEMHDSRMVLVRKFLWLMCSEGEANCRAVTSRVLLFLKVPETMT
jgi:hypothetical protein